MLIKKNGKKGWKRVEKTETFNNNNFSKKLVCILKQIKFLNLIKKMKFLFIKQKDNNLSKKEKYIIFNGNLIIFILKAFRKFNSFNKIFVKS